MELIDPEINHTRQVTYPKLGNGLAATVDLVPGDVILQFGEPYILIVEEASLTKICSQCCYEKPNLERCSTCKVPWYCSPECQKIAWQAGHKTECNIFRLAPAIFPTETRALMRLLTGRVKLPPSRLPKLQHHGQLVRYTPRWEAIVLQSRAAAEYMLRSGSLKSPGPPDELVKKSIFSLCTMSCNAFRAATQDKTPIGLCFEPLAALANHSCAPNAFVVFDGRRMAVVAEKMIKSGEQIFLSYIDITKPRIVRQDELMERYFFSCECERCEAEKPAVQSASKRKAEPQEQYRIGAAPPRSFH